MAKAEATRTTNPLMSPVVYWRTTTFLLALVAVLGFLWNAIEGSDVGVGEALRFDWTHDVVHLVLAATAFLFAFGNLPPRPVKVAAAVGGSVYLLLGALGFVPAFVAFMADRLMLHLEWGENVFHLLIGAWGLLTGVTKAD